ncbi:hypothetical protein EVAR_3358_1 [Eumeta japonica]|uniref:Uncharacterized protein n=1 Tax=Eumeta variegata TaxID=151549 RepID=A0A4C1SRZ6_EUMVA|nr:hypothetical protein EVAR_3358_1 [Eumeta japonica]
MQGRNSKLASMEASYKLDEGRLKDKASLHTGLVMSFLFMFFFLTCFPFTKRHIVGNADTGSVSCRYDTRRDPGGLSARLFRHIQFLGLLLRPNDRGKILSHLSR